MLCVEDNHQTRILLKHLLEGPYQVTLAPGVEEALRAADSQSFDLLLLNIELGPGKDGRDLLLMIRNRYNDRGRDGDIPGIALTASAMPGDREELLDEGFDEYVSKPFTRTELIKAIEQTVKG